MAFSVGVPVHERAGDDQGFTLVEMAIVVLILGLTIAITIGGFHSISADQQLKDSARSMVSQVTLARMRAMATGTTQTVNLDSGSSPQQVVIVGAGGSRKWQLPRDVHYATGSATTFNMTADGRASASAYIVLQNSKGMRDTVSVESSGLVIAQ